MFSLFSSIVLINQKVTKSIIRRSNYKIKFIHDIHLCQIRLKKFTKTTRKTWTFNNHLRIKFTVFWESHLRMSHTKLFPIFIDSAQICWRVWFSFLEGLGSSSKTSKKSLGSGAELGEIWVVKERQSPDQYTTNLGQNSIIRNSSFIDKSSFINEDSLVRKYSLNSKGIFFRRSSRNFKLLIRD